jgi:hypothetical protein
MAGGSIAIVNINEKILISYLYNPHLPLSHAAQQAKTGPFPAPHAPNWVRFRARSVAKRRASRLYFS